MTPCAIARQASAATRLCFALATVFTSAAASAGVRHAQDGEFTFRPACGGEADRVTARFVENVDRSPDPGFQVYDAEPFTLRVPDDGAFDHVVVYFTTDGSIPSGTFGRPFGSTQIAHARRDPAAPGARTPCPDNGPATATIPGQRAGTRVAYVAGAWSDAEAVEQRSGDAGRSSYDVIGGAPTPLMIREFRLQGPNGANDEFIEIYNSSNTSHTVASPAGSTGYAIAASDGVARCIIPNGTFLRIRGHYLCVNSLGYSLTNYPSGSGGTAAGDGTYTTNIPINAGIALFQTSTPASFTLANRIDAVGSTSEANTVYKEGTGYPSLSSAFFVDDSLYRDDCGKQGSIPTMGACPSGGLPVDTNNNATNFVFVDTNGTSLGAGQRLGAPGPQNQESPRFGDSVLFAHAQLDTCVPHRVPPNRVRDFTSDPANNSTFGTLDIRRTFTNNTGVAITRLRFRVVDLTTFPAPSGIADLRPRTSSDVVVAGVDRPPCGVGVSVVTVRGTTLEQPPSQPNGGGFGSSFGVGAVTAATPLAAGASIDVHFLLGIQQTGRFKLGLVPETSPVRAGPMLEISCRSDLEWNDLIFADGFDCYATTG